MKRIVLIILCLLSIIGCQDRQKRAERLVKREMREFSHYKPISFSELSPTYTLLDNDSSYKCYSDSLAIVKKTMFEQMMKIQYLVNRFYTMSWFGISMGSIDDNVSEESAILQSLRQDSIYFANKVDSISLAFVPEQIGWEITHVFLLREVNSQTEITNKYCFDLPIKRITDIQSQDF